MYAVKSGLEITWGFLGVGGGVERRTVNRTLAPARNGFTQRQRQRRCRFLKEKVKVGRGQKRNPQAVGHQGVFGKTPLFQRGAAVEKSSRRRGRRAAPMGAKGWCLLLWVALSRAADTGEWGAGRSEVAGWGSARRGKVPIASQPSGRKALWLTKEPLVLERQNRGNKAQ